MRQHAAKLYSRVAVALSFVCERRARGNHADGEFLYFNGTCWTTEPMPPL